MSLKRSRDTLTGGTGDVSPQFLTFSASQSGADTTTTITQTLPIEKFGSAGKGARIIEVLKVFFQIRGNNLEVDSNFQIYLSTKNGGTTAKNFSDTDVFAAYNERRLITTSGTFLNVLPYSFDCTDGAGHGFLVATDNIFCQIISLTSSFTNVVDVKILYRFKSVGLSEYIGIVQGQQ
jgi:hypothetical protein